MAIETARIDEHGNTKQKLLNIDNLKKQSRRMSQELNQFFETKYGYDGRSAKARDSPIASHRSELVNMDQQEVHKRFKTKAGRANIMSKEDLQFMSSG